CPFRPAGDCFSVLLQALEPTVGFSPWLLDPALEWLLDRVRRSLFVCHLVDEFRNQIQAFDLV
ncbi:MAG: hypothetical protein WAK19_14435, partial [Candidatus Cybelea sp.]